MYWETNISESHGELRLPTFPKFSLQENKGRKQLSAFSRARVLMKLKEQDKQVLGKHMTYKRSEINTVKNVLVVPG